MIFDWSGLKDHKYFVLKQCADPLKYCIGLPLMPCDLPNQYELYATNEQFTQQGDIYLTFEEQVSLVHRILIPASHRPWSIIGKDYYHHTPYIAYRDFNKCLTKDRPTVRVYFQQKYIGKIIQTTILNCCCMAETYQQLQVYDCNEHMNYKIVSRNPQRGHFMILPCWGFQEIKYDIIEYKNTHIGYKNSKGYEAIREDQAPLSESENNDREDQDEKRVGGITHLFGGLSEYTSKNDKYGLQFPQGATEADKCLLVYSTLLIDYLLFKNF